MSQVAYEIVRALGFFDGRKWSALRGALVVALVYQVFYEIFDQLGPQLKWWAWNVDEPFYNAPAGALGNPSAMPLLDSVPWSSVWLFATVSFAVLIFACVLLVKNPTIRGRRVRGWSLVWRVVVAGAVAGQVAEGLLEQHGVERRCRDRRLCGPLEGPVEEQAPVLREHPLFRPRLDDLARRRRLLDRLERLVDGLRDCHTEHEPDLQARLGVELQSVGELLDRLHDAVGDSLGRE